MTIKDIAEASGVSTATVSRVMNNLNVHPETRKKVAAVIAQMDYQPSPMARGLMKKKSHAVAVMCTSISNPYYMEIAESIEQRARNHDQMLFLCSTKGKVDLERDYLKELTQRQVDGIISIDPMLENTRNGLFAKISTKVPLVLVHSIPNISGINSVIIDQGLAMAELMEQFTRLGHHNIAFIREAERLTYDIKEEAWKRGSTYRHRDYPGCPGPLLSFPNTSSEDAAPRARELVLQMLDRPRATWPSAIFACNDIMALGALEALRERKLRIPEDMSIVSHDNTLLAGSLCISSIDLKMKSVGHAAYDLLLSTIEAHDQETRRVLITPSLIDRGSLGGVATT